MEILLATAVFAFVVMGLIGAIVYGRSSTASAGDHARAAFIAEEGVEATRNIVAASYATLVDGTYGVTQTGNQWNLAGTSDVTGIFTRRVTIATAATNRKTVTSTVTWAQGSSGAGSVTVTGRLANWAAPMKLWSNAVFAGATDGTGTGNAIKTASAGNYTYTVLSSTTNNFVITNIATPTALVKTSTITLAGTPTNIFISGNYAYVTNISDTAELQVVDIANPAAPVLRTSVNMVGTGNGQGVHVSGNYAYVARVADGTTNAFELTIVNITAPLTPVVTGGYNNTASFNEVYTAGTMAYVATTANSSELLVVNAANPALPVLVGSFNASTNTAALTIDGFGSTVLLGIASTLYAITVTTPTAPAQLGTFTAAGTVNDIEVDITNRFAFLGTTGTAAEFQAVNIATITALSLAKTVNIIGTSSTIGGVGYSNTLDIVSAASASDTQEIIALTRN